MTFEYDVPIIRTYFYRTESYMAKVIGADPNYVLKRQFLDYHEESAGLHERTRNYIIDPGVYECSLQLYDIDTGERIREWRWWVICSEDEYTEYPYDEMNRAYAQYAAWYIESQS